MIALQKTHQKFVWKEVLVHLVQSNGSWWEGAVIVHKSSPQFSIVDYLGILFCSRIGN